MIGLDEGIWIILKPFEAKNKSQRRRRGWSQLETQVLSEIPDNISFLNTVTPSGEALQGICLQEFVRLHSEMKEFGALNLVCSLYD